MGGTSSSRTLAFNVEVERIYNRTYLKYHCQTTNHSIKEDKYPLFHVLCSLGLRAPPTNTPKFWGCRYT